MSDEELASELSAATPERVDDKPGLLALQWSAPLLEGVKARMAGGWQPPLGIRISNPCYVRFNERFVFSGQEGRTEAGLCKFSSPLYGIRAFAINVGMLMDYWKVRNISSLATHLMAANPMLIGNVAIFLSKYLNHHQDTDFDLSKRGTDFAQGWIAFNNATGTRPECLTHYYPDAYVSKAIHLSHII